MTNPFKNHIPEESALILEQTFAQDDEVMIRCQLEGRGSDIVHMLAMALSADAKEGGVLRQMLMDALEIGVGIDSSNLKLRINRIEKPKAVN